MNRAKGYVGTTKQANIHTVGVPEEEVMGGGIICEDIMADNFPNLMKDTNINIQEAHELQVR